MTHSCKCGGLILETVYSVVCSLCGNETQRFSTKIQSFAASSLGRIVVSPYCRKQRFVGLLRKILGVDSGPPITDRVWQVLAQSAPFNTTQDIICCLKNSTLKTKHYTNLHTFAKAFLRNYTAPSNNRPLQVEILLEQLFDEVLFRWNRARSGNNNSFFSYAWLLEKLFKTTGLFKTYRPYIKVLICPNRRQKYISRWDEITTPPLRDLLPFRNDTPQVPLETV